MGKKRRIRVPVHPEPRVAPAGEPDVQLTVQRWVRMRSGAKIAPLLDAFERCESLKGVTKKTAAAWDAEYEAWLKTPRW